MSNIFEKLKFNDVGLSQIQSVDEMSVIPIIGQDRGETAEPNNLRFSRTVQYGEMVFENTDSKPAIVPSNYMVRGKGAQDQATSTVGILAGNKQKTYRNACCIESSQGGMLHGAEQDDVLPVTLRKVLLDKQLRSKRSFKKLWTHITTWLSGLNVGTQAHLRYFYDNSDIKKELETFAAEFEPVDKQIGAIIMFNDAIVGLEIMPTHQHWQAYWKKIIRGCYGAELIRQKRLGKIKPSTLILPDFPDSSDPDEIGRVVSKFNDHLMKEVLPILDNIKVSSIDPIENVSSLSSRLVTLEGGAGGDLVVQGSTPVYLSLVL